MSSAFSIPRCGCDPDDALGIFTVDNIHQCQKISDFLIFLAYFSIPLELLYFVSCSTVFPFRWVLIQFGFFIVLCGLTHLANVWTYSPHSFQLMLTLTVLKFLTAMVSCATAVTLVTLIPQLLRVMVREGLLIKKTRDLDRDLGKMKRQEEASWHVRMLTQEIRKSLDRHTILYTTLVELSKVLFLENCVIWMPNDANTEMILTHELKRRGDRVPSIPIGGRDVTQIVRMEGVTVLSRDSVLRDWTPGSAAAVRLPLLKVSNFKGGTPQELVEASYAVLVLVLPLERNRGWAPQDLEIVEVVADQVAVALSHAAVLEDSLSMREKLLERNMVLERARRQALLANEARRSFRKVLSREMMNPARSITAVLSILQLENFMPEQRGIIDTMAKGSLLLTTIVEDGTDISNLEGSGLQLKLSPFSLQSMLKAAISISKLLCACKGLCFDFEVSKEVPDFVIGDEKRIIQIVLYLVGNVVSFRDWGTVILRVCREGESQGGLDPKYLGWKQTVYDEFMHLRFEVRRIDSNDVGSGFLIEKDKEISGKGCDEGLSFAVCKKLAELMHGSISASHGSQGLYRNMNLVIRLQLPRSEGSLQRLRYMDHEKEKSLLKGMNILLAEGDSFNRSITRKLLETLGCHLTAVSSWYNCSNTLHVNGHVYQLLLIDLHILEEDGPEVSARVRKLRSENWVLIVALTSKSDRDTRQRCLRNGIHGVIRKPVILQEIVDELQGIIQQTTAQV